MLNEYIWIIIAVLLLIVEAATMDLATIWFSAGAIFAWVAQIFGITVPGQIIVFVVSSGILLVLTRPLMKKFLNTKKVRTNADSLLGETAVVTEDIDNMNAKGFVKVKGQIWTSRSEDNSFIGKGEKVEIMKIEGVKLIVKKMEGEK